MGRRAKTDRPIEVAIQIPASVWEKVRSQLYSEIEQRIPFGAQSALMEDLLVQWLKSRGVPV